MRKSIRKILAISSLALGPLARGAVLSGCMSTGAMMAPPPPPEPADANPMGTFETPLVGRELAGPQTYLGPMPTATILLKSSSGDRNASFCQGYLAAPQTGETLTQSVTAPSVVTMRWLLKAEPKTAPTACQDLIAGYDFDRAKMLLDGLAELPDAPDLAGPGPFIVEWMPDGSAVVFDGSARSVPALRQMPLQWVFQTGATLTPEGQSTMMACVGESLGQGGDIADHVVAYMKCQFPGGLDVKAIKAVSCSLLGLAGDQLPGGGYVRMGVRVVCAEG